jgi:hypothetical protein
MLLWSGLVVMIHAYVQRPSIRRHGRTVQNCPAAAAIWPMFQIRLPASVVAMALAAVQHRPEAATV